MEMDDSDGEDHHADDGVVSDDESVNGDGTKSKKKKSQRFYCTDYPPCSLSFTRSEHLARHIRYGGTVFSASLEPVADRIDLSAENTPASALSNVTAPDDSRVSTTSDNMRRLCT